MRVEAFPTDPLQIRALTLRQRSLLRQYATEAAGLDESVSLLASGPEPVAKPKKRGRRAVRFAPLVDVYESSFPDDFSQEEYEALWISRVEYEEAKKEFTDTIMALQTDALDSADLFMDESEIPEGHPLHQYCLRGCEKYFDLGSRFRIRQVIAERVLEFYKQTPNDPEALRAYAEALTSECADLAYWHGKLNALHCWGNVLQKYRRIKKGISRQVRVLAYSFSVVGEDAQPQMDSIEVILDPSDQSGCRTLSEIV